MRPPDRPPLPDPASEEAQQLLVFAESYARDGDVIRAIALADLTDSRYSTEVVARKTLARPEVKAFIAAFRAKIEMEKQAPAEMAITREALVSRLDKIYDSAMKDRDRGAAIAAVKLQSILLGFHKQEIDFNITHSVQEMSTDQLLKIAKRGQTLDGEFTRLGIEDKD